MVKSVVAWFKQYREILESDIVHGRRADGRDLDWVLHANPELEDKGMLCVYNPLPQEATKTLRVHLYYTGVTSRAEIETADGSRAEVDVDGDDNIELTVQVPANGMRWYVIREK